MEQATLVVPKQMVFWRRDSKWIYEYAQLRDGVYYYGNQTLADLRTTVDPAMELVSEDEYIQTRINQVITPITEITAEIYNDHLEMLPPVCWTTAAGVESFKMSERIFDNITSIYAKRGNRYFSFDDSIYLTPHMIADRVKDFINQ